LLTRRGFLLLLCPPQIKSRRTQDGKGAGGTDGREAGRGPGRNGTPKPGRRSEHEQ